MALVVVVVVIVGSLGVIAAAGDFELVPRSAGDHGNSTVTLTDDLGRTVSAPSHPGRVIVLAASIMDSMARLGLRSHVVGVDCESAAFGGLSGDYTPGQIAAWNLNSSMCVQVGPTVNIEEVLALTPDVVLASTIISLSNIEELSTTYHLPVLVLQPATIGGILVDETILGQLFGVAGVANSLNAQMSVALAESETVAANLSASMAALPTVLLTYYVTPAGSPQPGYWTYGPGTFGESLIELASGTSIAASATTAYPELSGAQVLADAPQVIVYGTGFGLDLPQYEQGPDWSSLPAVTSGQTFGLDSSLLTEPGPSMILTGLHLLLVDLHPTLVPG